MYEEYEKQEQEQELKERTLESTICCKKCGFSDLEYTTILELLTDGTPISGDGDIKRKKEKMEEMLLKNHNETNPDCQATTTDIEFRHTIK